jgi:hypothetical protein
MLETQMLRTALVVLCGAMLPVAAATPAAEPGAEVRPGGRGLDVHTDQLRRHVAVAMSLQDAHAFIVWLREHSEGVTLGDETMAGVIEAGKAVGFSFDEADLRAAHAHDWVLRWIALRSQTAKGRDDDLDDKRAANPRANAK